MTKEGLTDKQASFVREYCVDKNAAQAALRAGYSKKTAYQIGAENLSKPYIRAAIDDALLALAKKTETESEWIRRRLKHEADDRGEGATHAGRVRALELLAKMNGLFEADNRQRTGDIADAIRAARSR